MFSLAGRSLAPLDPAVHCSVSASAAHVSQAAMTPVRAACGCRVPQPCAASDERVLSPFELDARAMLRVRLCDLGLRC